MTEAEWLGCDDPRRMLTFVAWSLEEGAYRKARLFAVACTRRVWRRLSDERSCEAVRMAERFADGLATLEQLREARDASQQAADGQYLELDDFPEYGSDVPYAAGAAYFAASPRLFRWHVFNRGWHSGGTDGAAYYAAEAAGQGTVEAEAGKVSDEAAETIWDESRRAETSIQC